LVSTRCCKLKCHRYCSKLKKTVKILIKSKSSISLTRFLDVPVLVFIFVSWLY